MRVFPFISPVSPWERSNRAGSNQHLITLLRRWQVQSIRRNNPQRLSRSPDLKK
jgi:hypothetical protein